MTTTPQQYIVVDDDGTPSAFVDVDKIQAQATRLAYDMATAAGDPAALEQVTARHLAEAGTGAFGYVTAAALRMLAEHILEPTLQVCDALHAGGHLPRDIRGGLADAARNAREALA